MTQIAGLIKLFTKNIKYKTKDAEKRAMIIGSTLISGFFTVFILLFLSTSLSHADASITISKLPNDQSVLPGSPAFYTITLTNTGDVVLTNIGVTDFQATGCFNFPGPSGIPDLNPGESYSYICASDPLYEDLLNVATVTAGLTDTVSASDTAFARGKHLVVEKAPELQTVNSGQTASYTITLRNTGGFTLTDLVVTDFPTPNCDESYTTILPNLGPGESVVYTCQTIPLFEDFENALTATAIIEGGPMLTRRAFAVVEVHSPLEITISPDWQVILSGKQATFDIFIRNNGSTQLTDVAVSNPASPDCGRSAGAVPALNPGETHSYSCKSPVLSGDLANGVTASAFDGGAPVFGSGFAYVDASPPIDITVAPSSQVLTSNLTATFTVTLSNSLPNLELIDVIVDSPTAPDCTRALGTIGDLAPSAVISYTCQAAVNPILVLYDITAFASPFDGDPVFDMETVYAGPLVRYLPSILKAGAP